MLPAADSLMPLAVRWGHLLALYCYDLFEGTMAEQTRLCEWCSQPYTFTRSGRGRPPRYCSPACKVEAQRALNAGRVRRYRARTAELQPPIPRPRGRPTGR
jgi:hypothetical protein